MTAPTFKKPPAPPADDWSSLEDGTFDDAPAHAWSSSRAARPAVDKYAKTDIASGVSLGSRASTQENRNQVAQFKCDACHGSGRWYPRSMYSNHPGGPCRKCKGTGKLKTDPEARARQKKGREDAKKKRLGDYIAAHTPEYTWAITNMAHFGFALSMYEAVKQHGAWTDGQLAAIRKCMARDEEREKQREATKAAAPVIAGEGFDRMLAAFASARASGLKRPKLRIDEFTFALASETSKYVGRALFVKLNGIYMGRIDLEGRWFPSPQSSEVVSEKVKQICSDPLAAAVMHGKQTGHCSCCGLELTNEESVRLGIGPICREKWGL